MELYFIGALNNSTDAGLPGNWYTKTAKTGFGMSQGYTLNNALPVSGDTVWVLSPMLSDSSGTLATTPPATSLGFAFFRFGTTQAITPIPSGVSYMGSVPNYSWWDGKRYYANALMPCQDPAYGQGSGSPNCECGVSDNGCGCGANEVPDSYGSCCGNQHTANCDGRCNTDQTTDENGTCCPGWTIGTCGSTSGVCGGEHDHGCGCGQGYSVSDANGSYCCPSLIGCDNICFSGAVDIGYGCGVAACDGVIDPNGTCCSSSSLGCDGVCNSGVVADPNGTCCNNEQFYWCSGLCGWSFDYGCGCNVDYSYDANGSYCCPTQIGCDNICNSGIVDIGFGCGVLVNPNAPKAWDNFANYFQGDVVSEGGFLWLLVSTGGWTVGGNPNLGYGWQKLSVGGGTEVASSPINIAQLIGLPPFIQL